MEYPLISVILPIYNVEKYLPVCMESLFLQTYKNIEILMIDDGSKDNCFRLCEKYAEKDPRVKVYHKQNGGLANARNYGAEHAQGEYITYVDPDDYIDPDYVEYLFALIKKYKTKMSVCQHRIRYCNGTVKDGKRTGDEELSVSECLKKMLYHDVIDMSAWAKLYHRSLFDVIRYPDGKIFEDTATTYRLVMECDAIAIGYETKYNYLFHENSIVNSQFQLNKLDLLEATDNMVKDIVKSYPGLIEATIRRQVYARFSTLNQMLEIDGYMNIKDELIQFIKKHKRNILYNNEAPKRDKVAVLLILLNYQLYRFCWLCYRRYIMRNKI